MNGLDSLIRLHKWRLDEKRREAADLERLIAQRDGELDALAEEVVHEGEVAGTSDMAAFDMGTYVKGLVDRKGRLIASIAQARHRLTAVGDEIAEAFAELKRFELIAQERRRQADMARKRRETAELDEIASVRHARRESRHRARHEGARDCGDGSGRHTSDRSVP